MPTYIEQLCPRCGGPLPNTVASGLMHCEYCSTPLVPSHGAYRLVADQGEDRYPDAERVWLKGRRYAIEGRIARGEASDVYLGRWDTHLSERVVIKRLREDRAKEHFDNGWSVISQLARSTHKGADHFSRLLPAPIAHGTGRLGLHGTDGSCEVSIYRYAGGFVHTFVDIRKQYPGGIPAQASVWLWKRIVETLAWVHSTGHVHGGILPEHLLVHSRDHGVRLLGWSRAVRGGGLKALTEGREAFYPSGAWGGEAVLPATDLAMSARCILWLLSGDPAAAARSTSTNYSDLLLRTSRGEESDGWLLLKSISQIAQDNYGPPTYVPFAMPGWSET